MTSKWAGSLDQLKNFIEQLGFTGTWKSGDRGKETFQTLDCGVMNYWPESKKKLSVFRGKITNGLKRHLKKPIKRRLQAIQKRHLFLAKKESSLFTVMMFLLEKI